MDESVHVKNCINADDICKMQYSYLPECKSCPEMVPSFGEGTFADTNDNAVVFGRCYDMFRCPDLSPLKFVRVLYMHVSGPLHDELIDWGCLYCLSSLQALTLHSTFQGLKIDQNLTVGQLEVPEIDRSLSALCICSTSTSGIGGNRCQLGCNAFPTKH